MLELVAPSKRYQQSFLEAIHELALEGTKRELGDNESFASMLARFADHAAGRNLRPGHVPETVLWLVDGSEYVGRVSVRHTLTDRLRATGGHIGYVVRPSRRREGHGHRLLERALPHAHALGIDPALVTCDEDNLASRRIIERCGGVLATDVVIPGELRYWVPTGRT